MGMKNIKIFLALGVFLTLQSCANPFDLKAIKKEVASLNPFALKAATNIISGGSAPVTTAGGYKVTNSIGVLSTLPKVTTAGGYKVSSSLNSD